MFQYKHGGRKITPCSVAGCMSNVSMLVATLLVGSPLITSLKDNMLPQMLKRMKKYQPKTKTWYEDEYERPHVSLKQEPLIMEYLTCTLQYSLVVLFAAVVGVKY